MGWSQERHREIMAGIEYRAALIRFLAAEAARDEGLGGWRKDYSMERDVLWSEINELERELHGQALENQATQQEQNPQPQEPEQ